MGGAVGIAAHVGGALGAALAHLARTAFITAMDLGLAAGAIVAAAGSLIALVALPARPGDTSQSPASPLASPPAPTSVRAHR